MTIIRGPRSERYTVLGRSLINDDRLSFRALGILTYILDKPDDWRIESTALADTHKEGRDAVRTALTELETCGYLTRTRYQNAKGQWVTDSVVNDGAAAPGAAQPAVSGTPGVSAEDGNPGVGDPPSDAWESDAGKPGAGFPGALTSTETSTETDTDARFARVAPPAACAAKDALYMALCRVCHMDYDEMTDPQRKRTGVAVSQLMKVHATVEQIEQRAQAYLERHTSSLTPTALASQWASLRDAPMPQQATKKSIADAGIELARAARRSNVVPLYQEPDDLLERNTS